MQFRIQKLNQVEEISDDDSSNDENDELEQESMGFTILEKIKRYPVFDDDSQNVVYDHKRIEDFQLKNWKQTSIKAYFNKNL